LVSPRRTSRWFARAVTGPIRRTFRVTVWLAGEYGCTSLGLTRNFFTRRLSPAWRRGARASSTFRRRSARAWRGRLPRSGRERRNGTRLFFCRSVPHLFVL